MLLVALAVLPAAAAHAQSADPFRPALQDPRNPQRFTTSPDAARDRSVAAPPPSAGETGFDSTGSISKRRKRLRPGERNVGLRSIETRVVPPARGVAQQTAARPVAPQVATRAAYADAYSPPDAPARARRGAAPVQDAFEPVGIRAGSFVLRPSIEVSRGYDTNASRTPGGRASQFTVVTPELQAKSEWSRHELAATLRGSYSHYDSDSFLNRPSGEGRVTGRIDAARDTQFHLEGRAIVGTDNPGSPNVETGLSKLPLYTTLGATAGVTQRFNHLELSARALFDRTAFQDSKLLDGTTASNADRNYNQIGGQLRAGYEVTPGFKPFVEIGADRRVHDQLCDRNCVRRDSDAVTPRVGATFELTRLLTGEVSVGYTSRRYKDPSLQPLNGVVADGSLVWAATGLTTATLTASSRAEESILPGVSGALRRDAGLKVDHAFRRWLIGTASFGYGLDQYVGLGREDTRTSLGLALSYKLNRELWLKGEFRQEWLQSSAPGAIYDASIFMLGVKAQR